MPPRSARPHWVYVVALLFLAGADVGLVVETTTGRGSVPCLGYAALVAHSGAPVWVTRTLRRRDGRLSQQPAVLSRRGLPF